MRDQDARRRDVAAEREADFYCRCGVGHAYGERCEECGCDYFDSTTLGERDEEA